MGLTILLGIFGVSVVIGIPVAFAMGIAALTAFWYEGFPLLITFQRSVSGISVFSLLAIPFFVFAGELMLHGGIAMRLVKFASALVGHVRGGLASVNIFSSMLFGGISGSAVADISALGSILIPVMKERGYHSDYAVNVTVTSSIAGIVIPPSHNMIIFAVAAGGGISISKLFLAGVVPGMLMCLCLAVAAYVIAIKRNYPAEPFPGWRAVGVASLHALPGLVTAVIIVGGVLSGIFTVTESGAFGAIYALLLTYFVYRSLDWNGFKTAVVSAVRTTAMVMVLIGFASSFAYLLALYQVPEKLSSFMLGISEEKIAVLLMINIMLLVLDDHGYGRADPDLHPDLPAHCARSWHGPHPVRDHAAGQPRAWSVHAPRWHLPVRGLCRWQGQDRGNAQDHMALLPGHSDGALAGHICPRGVAVPALIA